jgi:hypothetical protein
MVLRRRRIVAWATPPLAALLLGACFNFDATIAGGPLGAEEGGTTLDAGVHDGSTVQPDGAAPPPHDAGHDGATPPTGDAAGGYCASITPAPGADAGLFFCDDFDELPLPGLWESYGETSGTLVQTDASFRSSPNSVEEQTIPLDGGAFIDVSLRRPEPLPPNPSTIRFAFSVEPLQIDTTPNAAIVLGAVDFIDAAGNRYSVSLAVNVANAAAAIALGEQSGFEDGGSAFVNHPVPPNEPLAMNAWSDIVIEIDWTSPAAGTAILTVNGNPVLQVPLSWTVAPTSLQIGIGTAYVSQPSPGWALRYDNVVFTAQ